MSEKKKHIIFVHELGEDAHYTQFRHALNGATSVDMTSGFVLGMPPERLYNYEPDAAVVAVPKLAGANQTVIDREVKRMVETIEAFRHPKAGNGSDLPIVVATDDKGGERPQKLVDALVKHGVRVAYLDDAASIIDNLELSVRPGADLKGAGELERTSRQAALQ